MLKKTEKLCFTVNDVEFEMILVEGGTFMMGSDDSDADDNEKPVHSVTLSDYYIGKYVVTQRLWEAVWGDDSYQFDEGDYPRNHVNYRTCEHFCVKLNKLLSDRLPEGYRFCLPTEAQWEYAARGGNKSKGYKYSGSNDVNEVAWYDGVNPVGTKLPNELGIYDMSGNVAEWCQEWYKPYSSSESSRSERVLRGFAYRGDEKACRVTYRTWNLSGNSNYFTGFRLALSAI